MHSTTTHIPEASHHEKERARERAELLHDVSKNHTEDGVTREMSKTTKAAEAKLKQRAAETGSKPMVHAANVVEAERRLMEEKDLGDRFLRITNRLRELKEQQARSGDKSAFVDDFAKDIESLRSLLRLVVRSTDFRSTLGEALKMFHRIFVKIEAEEERHHDHHHEKVSVWHQSLTDEEWNILVDELDPFFTRLSTHTEYRKGLKQFFTVGSSLIGKVSSKVESSSEKTEITVKSLQKETKELIIQFTGEELHKLISRSRKLSRALAHDEKARHWWSSTIKHILKVSETYEGKEDLEEFRERFNEGRGLLREYKPQLNKVLDSLQTIMENVANDKYLIKLRENLSNLTDDLYWKDKDGKRYFDYDAAGSLASVISEVIKDQFKCVAIPRLEKEGKTSYTADNIIVQAILPEKFGFHLETDVDLDSSAHGGGSSLYSTKLYITTDIKKIQAQAKDIEFSYKRSGLSDSGRMDVILSDAELTIDFVLQPNRPSSHTPGGTSVTKTISGPGNMRYQFVKLKTRFSIRDATVEFDKKTLHHSVLSPMLATFFKARMVDKIETSVEEALDKSLISLGENVVSILNSAPNPLSLSSFASMSPM